MCAQAREKTVAAAATGCKLEEEAAVAASAAEERPPEIIQTSLQWRGTNRVEYIATDAASSNPNGNPECHASGAGALDKSSGTLISFSQSFEQEE